MKKLLLLGAAAAFSANAMAVVVYDNTNTSTVTIVANGGATVVNTGTKVVADLLNFAPGFGGWKIGRVDWAVGNLNTTSTSARMRIRFWEDNAGAPGTLIGGVSFSATPIPSGPAGFFFDFTAQNYTIPASGKVWMGFLFDGTGTTTSLAALNNLGLCYHSNAPVVGSSADSLWVSSAPGTNFVNSPAGTVASSPFAANPVANAYYAVQAVPEPATVAALGLGLAAVARRRRSK
ncbi:MAG: PEP-CTERM sorting domain-containing protein [Chthonomonas sp.]|nr:PEP-CTERM sorting domain-containing protein [Chthonomonas sp.]